MRTALLILIITVSLFPQHLDPALGEEISGRFGPQKAAEFESLMAQCGADSIPAAPVQNKIHEGLAKNKSAAQIYKAAQTRLHVLRKMKANGQEGFPPGYQKQMAKEEAAVYLQKKPVKTVTAIPPEKIKTDKNSRTERKTVNKAEKRQKQQEKRLEKMEKKKDKMEKRQNKLRKNR